MSINRVFFIGPSGLTCCALLLASLTGCTLLTSFPDGEDGAVPVLDTGAAPPPDRPLDPGPPIVETDARPPDEGEPEVPEIDPGVVVDAGPDAPPTEPPRDAETDGPCDLATHLGCGADELCCDGAEGPACVPTDATVQCAACGKPCDGRGANSCEQRTCTCGDGRCEPATPLCDGRANRCVECLSDTDCATSRAGRFCTDGVCTQCDRGNDLDSAEDDRGCSGATPICGADNTCTGCSDSPDNCPGSLSCVLGRGCFGCSPDAPLEANGCAAASPICEVDGTLARCVPCGDDGSCMGRYCDEPPGGGACYAQCDPGDHAGCDEAEAPLCRVRDGSASCVGCNAQDAPPCPDGQFCLRLGFDAGQCVQCRVSTDCGGDTPICDVLQHRCRACSLLTEALDCFSSRAPACDTSSGTCVECRQGNTAACGGRTPVCGRDHTCRGCAHDDECRNTAAPACLSDGSCAQCSPSETSACRGDTPVCNFGTNTCVQCTPQSDSRCSGSTPVCGGDNRCRGCATDAECSDASAPACGSGGACVQCSASEQSSCRGATPACDTAAGRCVQCTPQDDDACTAARPVCDPGTLSCVECTAADTTACGPNQPVCAGNRCVACASNDDCSEGQRCNIPSGECVPCSDGEADC